MATLLTLYSVEAGVEPVVVTVVSTELAAVTGLQVIRSRQDVDKTTPRVEVQLTVGGFTMSRYPRRADIPFNEWNARLSFIVVTDRKTNGSAHDGILGRLRLLALYGQNKFASTPTDHVLIKIEEAGTDHNVVTGTDEQETRLHYDCRIGIRESSWP